MPSFGRTPKTSADGQRVAVLVKGDEGSHVDLFDLVEGRRVFSTPSATNDNIKERGAWMRVSPSGRSILDGARSGLWSDAGRLLWPRRPWELYIQHWEDQSFQVAERWDGQWSHGWLRNWDTIAVRDLDTGAVRFRCWERDTRLRYRSPDSAYGVMIAGVVHRPLFQVNWPLLAFCQAILAMPMVLLWALLRTKRRRAAKRRPAEVLNNV